MEQSLEDMSERENVEKLTMVALVLAGKEVLSKKLLEIELQEIFDELTVI